MGAEELGRTRSRADLYTGYPSRGTLEHGNWANFMVWQKNPRADIAATKTLQYVFVAVNENH